MACCFASFFAPEENRMVKKRATPEDQGEYVKVTHYIRLDQVPALDRPRAKRLSAGRKLGEVDKSSLMREAIDMLLKKEGV
jgi:hypothetical protein